MKTHGAVGRRLLLGALGVVLLPAVALAEKDCTLRRSLFYTSDCPGQLTIYVYETIACNGEVHYHGHALSRTGSCPQYAE
jgi:hypothetical protein